MSHSEYLLIWVLDLVHPSMNRGAPSLPLLRGLGSGTDPINHDVHFLILLLDLDTHLVNRGVLFLTQLIGRDTHLVNLGGHSLHRVPLAESLELMMTL
jgi:hypothetical protein